MRHYTHRQDHYSPSSMRRAERTERKCLSCKKPFMSEGAHNRMCNQCRTNSGPKEYKLCL